jgi:hypothetical protein
VRARWLAVVLLPASVLVGGGIASTAQRPTTTGPGQLRQGSGLAATASRCPRALPPGQRAAGQATRVVQANLSRLAHGIDTRGANTIAAATLRRGTGAPGIDMRRYLRKAVHACRERIADRSWIVFVQLPNAPAANVSILAFYVVRTAHGWKPWYETVAPTGDSEFVDS